MAHEGVSKSLQVGIFSNDLCISFRIIMQELLEAYVNKIYDSAKRVAASSGEPLLDIFERGITSITKWDSALKERYRSQVSTQYRNLSDLYHHIFLMYVQEMYDQSLNNVTVRVNIPSMHVMLHTFLKTACLHNSVLRGEFITNMSFMGHVLFVETIIRRTLYELLVQQNNIKSITVEERKDAPAPAATSRAGPRAPAMSVHSVSEHVLSNDLSLRQPPQKSRIPTSVTTAATSQSQSSTGKFWQSPTNSSVNFLPVFDSPQTSETILAHPAPVASAAVAAAAAAANSPKPKSTVTSAAFSPASKVAVAAPSVFSPKSAVALELASAMPMPAVEVPKKPLVTISDTQVSVGKIKSSTATQSSQGSTQQSQQQSTQPQASVQPSQPQGSVPPPPPQGSINSAGGPEFTPHKPGGKSLPEPRVSLVDRNANDENLDSLQLLPSDQDYADEVKRLLDTNPSDTVTPFDSVTNVANGTQTQKAIPAPLFF